MLYFFRYQISEDYYKKIFINIKLCCGTALTDFSITFIMCHIIEMFDSWLLDLSELLYLTKQVSPSAMKRNRSNYK